VLLRVRWRGLPDTGDAITAGIAGLVIDGAARGRADPPDPRARCADGDNAATAPTCL
jgi:hypothetical protein